MTYFLSYILVKDSEAKDISVCFDQFFPSLFSLSYAEQSTCHLLLRYVLSIFYYLRKRTLHQILTLFPSVYLSIFLLNSQTFKQKVTILKINVNFPIFLLRVDSIYLHFFDTGKKPTAYGTKFLFFKHMSSLISQTKTLLIWF